LDADDIAEAAVYILSTKPHVQVWMRDYKLELNKKAELTQELAYARQRCVY